MNNKRIVITAAIVAVAMLAGIVATIPMAAVYAQESETKTIQKCYVDGAISSGESTLANAINCELGNSESFGP